MVRIRAFQARGPGSIPGRRIKLLLMECDTARHKGGLWCNWLAQWTLNPLIRVQIPAGPIGFMSLSRSRQTCTLLWRNG